MNIDDRILFFRYHTKHYYMYNNEIKKLNLFNLLNTKKELTLPYKIEFIGYSRAEVGKVCSTFKDYDIATAVVRVSQPTQGKTNPLHFAGVLLDKNKELKFSMFNNGYRVHNGRVYQKMV